MKNIYARGLLKVICYDMNNMLDNNEISSKTVLLSLKKRLDRIKNSNHQKVIWD